MKLNLRTLLDLRPVVEAAADLYESLRAAIDATDLERLRQALDALLDVDGLTETVVDLIDLLTLVRQVVDPDEWETISSAFRRLVEALERIIGGDDS